MEKIHIEARAKINLTLDVLYKRPDDYHEVEMIMQTIALKDSVYIELLPEKAIKLTSDCDCIPCDETNLAWKAADIMMSQYCLDAGLKITVHKKIPVAAGLAGGSADAAAVIKGVNRLFGLNKDEDELKNLGTKIGAEPLYPREGRLLRGIGEAYRIVYPKCCRFAGKTALLFYKEVYNRLI